MSSDYLTIEFMLTFSGAAIVVYLLTSVVQYLFGDGIAPYIKWVSFLASLGMAFLFAMLAGTGGWERWVVAAVNGFWLFAAVIGLNTQITKTTERGPLAAAAEGAEPEPKKFLARW